MTEVSLSEQLGALAVIDDLRHRSMVVQEHLDLPKRRDEVVRRIREYYAARKVEVDDATIEAGVKAYFDRRLTYEAAPLSGMQRRLAHLYVTRARWGRKLGVLTVAAALAGGAAGWIGHVRGEREQERLNAALIQQDSDTHASASQQQQELVRLRGQLADIQAQLAAHPLPAANRMLEPVPELIANAGRGLTLASHPAVDSSSREGLRPAMDEERAQVKLAGEQTARAAKALNEAQATLAAATRLRAVTASSAFKSGAAAMPALRDAGQRAAEALELADVQGSAAATQAVDHLTRLVADSGKMGGLLAQIDDVERQLTALPLPPDDRAVVQAKLEKARKDSAAMDANALEHSVQDLRQLHDYARTPLRIEVVDRAGAKSAVERRFRDGGGKSWFLVVEAKDPSGRVVPVEVTNIETGKTVQASQFAVRVTQSEYQRRKAEKQATGHISNRQVGSKPAGALSIQYSPDIGSAPDVITAW
jgi:hypothetical protein